MGLDADGESAPVYPLRDDLDLRHLRRALAELANLHEAAGAERILGLNEGPFQSWQRGQSLTEFVQTLAQVPFGAGGRVIFSAHQMGSARMGRDPETSVARPSGELHDARNVWIGDTSAFPTSLGVNPMITCMALASRTAAQIAG